MTPLCPLPCNTPTTPPLQDIVMLPRWVSATKSLLNMQGDICCFQCQPINPFNFKGLSCSNLPWKPVVYVLPNFVFHWQELSDVFILPVYGNLSSVYAWDIWKGKVAYFYPNLSYLWLVLSFYLPYDIDIKRSLL